VEEQSILDRYRPLADLGSGGHGSVVLAFDTRMARRVAIKRLPLPLDRSGRPLTRTGLAEARTAALLNHPAIVTVHEWDLDEADAYIVMEDIDGASLAEILDQRQAPLDLDEAAAVLESVGSALQYAHANGVLHLDIKPGNVLITRDGRPKVADFGIAALTDAHGGAAGAAGTIGYMPPEQIRGERLDERTDVWALASLMYEVLTNACPFDSDTPEGSLFKIEVAEVPAPSDFAPWIPDAASDVLLAALSPDPDERHDSVEAFIDALSPHLGKAATGREMLAAYLDDALGDELPFEGEYAGGGVWYALAPYSGWLLRGSAALVSGWLAWAGVSAMIPRSGAGAASAAIAGLAGALAPGLGLALGGVAISIGLGIMAEWWVGLVAFVLALAWWLTTARLGEGDSLLPAVAPVLGIARCAPFAPLIAGFVYTPVRAALAGGLSAITTIMVAAATGGASPLLVPGWEWLLTPWRSGVGVDAFLESLAGPGLILIPVSWALAAALCSLACGRGSRLWTLAGVAAGLAVMAGSFAVWDLLADDGTMLALAAIDLGVSAALMAAVVAAGSPPPRDD
jgi:serine/threonine-protein kinase